MDLNCSSLSTIAPAVRISFAISQCNDSSHPKVIYGARLEGIGHERQKRTPVLGQHQKAATKAASFQASFISGRNLDDAPHTFDSKMHAEGW